MYYVDRQGNITEETTGQDKLLAALYRHFSGRLLIKLLVRPSVTRIGSMFLTSRLSRNMIPGYIRRHDIDMSQFLDEDYRSFNDFFIRRVREDARPIDMDPQALISPCDSRLSVYPLDRISSFRIKNTIYTVETLTKSRKAKDVFAGGYALVFRLTVNDCHHYCYVDDGVKSSNHFIRGVLHTVNPVASETVPIYKENAREYSILRSKHFGDILMMEVGALMVGKIVNEHGITSVRRGEEKGHFEFGGSTVILLVQKDRVSIDADLLENTAGGMETLVRMGERIGTAIPDTRYRHAMAEGGHEAAGS